MPVPIYLMHDRANGDGCRVRMAQADTNALPRLYELLFPSSPWIALRSCNVEPDGTRFVLVDIGEFTIEQLRLLLIACPEFEVVEDPQALPPA